MIFQSTNKLKMSFLFALLVFLTPFSVKAMNGGFEQTLYEGMNYKKIFDQRNILAKYPDVLRQEGLEVVEPAPRSRKTEGCLKKCLHALSCNFFRGYEDIDVSSELGFVDNLKVNMHHINDSLFGRRRKELDEALAKDFKKKKRSAMKQALYQPIFNAGLYVTSFYVMPRLLAAGAPEGGVGEGASNSCAGASKSNLGQGIGNFAIGHVIANLLNNLSKAAYRLYISPLADPLEKYEILYAKRKRFLPRALQEKVEDKFSAARKSSQSIGDALNFARIALNLPMKSKELKPLARFKGEVRDLLRPYRPEIARKIKLKFHNHYARFSNRFGALDTPKSILYLEGPPGVGKTFVTNELTRLMGADLIELTAIENAESIIGSEREPGSLLGAICRPGVSRNAVILIDEIDHIVNGNNSSLQLFLPLLEPDAKYFYSPYLKANVDISHFCFILAGNSKIKDEALRSRATVIVIDHFSPDVKKEIVYQEMLDDETKQNAELLERIDALIEADKGVGIRELRGKVNDEITRWDMEQLERAFGGEPEEGEVVVEQPIARIVPIVENDTVE